MKSWQWSAITHIFFAIFISIIVVNIYLWLNPCPEIGPVDIEKEIITNEIIIRDTIYQTAEPIVIIKKAESDDVAAGPSSDLMWSTLFEMQGERWFGEILVEFTLPDSIFTIYPNFTIQPDTIRFTERIEMPKLPEIPKVKFLSAYLGGGVSLAYDDKFKIDGGCLDVGVMIKRKYLIYSSVDTHNHFWIKGGLTFN